jgi:hypothetical protein
MTEDECARFLARYRALVHDKDKVKIKRLYNTRKNLNAHTVIRHRGNIKLALLSHSRLVSKPCEYISG